MQTILIIGLDWVEKKAQSGSGQTEPYTTVGEFQFT